MENADYELVVRYRQGEKRALDLLTARYLKLVYAVALRYVGHLQDAEDVTQEVFIKVFRNLHKFNVSKSFRPWIIEIAKNTSLDWLKKKKPMVLAALSADEEATLLARLPSTLPSPAVEIENVEIAARINQALSALPPAAYSIFKAHYFEGLRLSDIAKALKVAVSTVKSRHIRGLIALRRILGEATDIF